MNHVLKIKNRDRPPQETGLYLKNIYSKERLVYTCTCIIPHLLTPEIISNLVAERFTVGSIQSTFICRVGIPEGRGIMAREE